ncbi:MAG: ribonuclease R [Bacteroidetes bacterium]|nr:ribonuclease R [Bacteroidota bacterium]
MHGKSHRKTTKNFRKSVRKNIIDLFSKFNTPLNYQQVSHRLGMSDIDGRNLVTETLVRLEHDGILEVIEQGKYRMRSGGEGKIVTGKLDFTSYGGAYLVTGDNGEDVFIPPGKTGNAFHGDTVNAEVLRKNRKGKESGRVTGIVERGKNEFTGVIRIDRSYAFVKCDNDRYPDFFIPPGKTGNSSTGDKVVVRLTDYPVGKNPAGEVIKVLGEPGDQSTEINSIIYEYDLPLEFPEKAEREAEIITPHISEKEKNSRRDFREVLTFTIDPVDAKDFDDALSFRKLPNGNVEVGVHIADVSHYVREGSNIDREARKRATSVYLVDRVISMLPENLSNHVCSLVPGEDRLCFAVVFEMNRKAELIHQWMGKTIIRSGKRFTYEDVQKILREGKGLYSEELAILDDLAKKMRALRIKKGAIGFDTLEVKFHLDKNGHPESVYLKAMEDSNRLIEDFMLLANRSVAEVFGKDRGSKRSHSFIYRVHPQPKEEKVKEFSDFVIRFGYPFKVHNPKDVSFAINKLKESITGKAEENIITAFAVRTMEKAYYTVKNIGHYGLAFEDYTHFTSPIRRYPDLVVHRLLERHLNKNDFYGPDEIEAICKNCSAQEKKAQHAEWDSVKYMQVKLLQDKVGQEFEGLVSGISEWGMYVEITEYKCEGLIRLKSITDDFYYYDAKSRSVSGSKKKKKFHIGDRVNVILTRADILKRQIDLKII